MGTTLICRSLSAGNCCEIYVVSKPENCYGSDHLMSMRCRLDSLNPPMESALYCQKLLEKGIYKLNGTMIAVVM